MKRLFLLPALFLLGAAPSPAAPAAPASSGPATTLDFTPRRAGDPDGFSRIYFNDGGKKYTVSLPYNTDVSGSRFEVTFRFENLRTSSFTLKLSPHSPEQPFDEENLPAYRQTAATLAPPGMQAPPAQEEKENPLAGNGWTSHRIISTYQLPGNNIRQSITFLNLTPTQQIIVIVTAFENEFERTSQQGEALLHSWRSLPEGELATPSLN